jgi:hypothetical protein
MPGILRRTSLTVIAVLVVAAVALVLVETGIAIGAGTHHDPAAAAATPSTASDNAGLAAGLDAILAADQTAAPAPAASTVPTPARARINAAVRGLRRLAAAQRLVHATVVADLPKLGGLTTIQIDHGTISAVSGTSLSVAETGGTTATVRLGDETRVRRNAAKATIGDLKTGDEVFVMSRVESDGTVAYLVVVPAI